MFAGKVYCLEITCYNNRMKFATMPYIDGSRKISPNLDSHSLAGIMCRWFHSECLMYNAVARSIYFQLGEKWWGFPGYLAREDGMSCITVERAVELWTGTQKVWIYADNGKKICELGNPFFGITSVEEGIYRMDIWPPVTDTLDRPDVIDRIRELDGFFR